MVTRYTAKQIADDVAAGMDPDVELVSAQHYDAMFAERDKLAAKEQCSHELFEAACNDLGDAQEEIAAATKTLSVALKHLRGDDYTLDGAETISTLATIAMHAMAGE